MTLANFLKNWGIVVVISAFFAFPVFLKAQNVFGNALLFNGIDGMVSINDSPALHQPDSTGKITIEAWVNNLVPANYSTIVEKAPDRWALYSMANGKLNFYIRSSSSVNLLSNTALQPGRWYHVAAVYDRSTETASIFINGRLDATTTGVNAQINGQTGGLGIGVDTDHNDGKFNGYIDEVRISSVARYDTNFAIPLNPFVGDSNTVVLYHFNEGTGTTTADSSGNGLTATLSGGVSWVGSTILTPVFIVDKSTLNFGSNLAGSILVDTVNVTNTGYDTLKVTSITSSDPNFSIAPISINLIPGNSQQFAISYLPLQSGTNNGDIIFLNNTAKNADTIQVTGSANNVSGFDHDLQFNGVDGMASIGDNPTLHKPDSTQKITIEAWVNNLVPANYSTIVEKAPDRWALYSMANGKLNFYIRSSSSVNLMSKTALQPGRWYHVAAVYDRSTGTASIFINGILDAKATGVNALINGQTGGLGIGVDTDHNDGKFNGYIDEVRISSVARYDTNFAIPLNPFVGDSNTVVLYHFNEGTGDVTGDASGNGNNCLLTGGVTWNTSSVLSPVFNLSNSKLDFGNTFVGSLKIDTIAITNYGFDTLKVTSVISTNPNFSVSSSQFVLAPDSSQIVLISFLPSTVGPSNGEVIFSDNGISVQDTLMIIGNVIAAQGFQNAISFDGVNGRVSCPNSTSLAKPNLTQKLTIDAWINIKQHKDYGVIVEKAPDRWGLYDQAGGGILFYIRGGAGAPVLAITKTKLLTGKWYQISAEYDSSKGIAKIYINGKIDTVFRNQSAIIDGQDGGLGIGWDTDLNDAKLDGSVDEVRISSVARYDTNSPSPLNPFTPDSNTMALYHFDEGFGKVTADASGNGNNCVFTDSGATWVTSDIPYSIPDIFTASDSISFDSVAIGGSLNETVKVINSGIDTLRINSANIKDSSFSMIGNLPISISAGESTYLTFNFKPKVAGSVRDTITINSNSYYNPEYNLVLIGNSTVTGISSNQSQIPKEFALYQSYPNPFNPSTIIQFDLPENSLVKLIIYDILGRKIRELVDKEMNAGQYKVNFNASILASGIYIYRIAAVPDSKDKQGFIKTKSMVLLK
ncbi:MAG: LamG-like jellyroll fold domain-containing protein [Ignavibacteriaceae bacterium]